MLSEVQYIILLLQRSCWTVTTREGLEVTLLTWLLEPVLYYSTSNATKYGDTAIHRRSGDFWYVMLSLASFVC